MSENRLRVAIVRDLIAAGTQLQPPQSYDIALYLLAPWDHDGWRDVNCLMVCYGGTTYEHAPPEWSTLLQSNGRGGAPLVIYQMPPDKTPCQQILDRLVEIFGKELEICES